MCLSARAIGQHQLLVHRIQIHFESSNSFHYASSAFANDICAALLSYPYFVDLASRYIDPRARPVRGLVVGTVLGIAHRKLAVNDEMGREARM